MKNGNLVTTIEIKDRHGRVVDTKEVVTYAGLLNRATQDNLKKVYTELIQLPSEANEMTAICMAEVVTDKGVFRDYGDANPVNVSSMIVPHIIRMASTRAKARAFRDAVNIGVVVLEELGAEYLNGVVDNSGNGQSQNGSNGKNAEQAANSKDKNSTSPYRYTYNYLYLKNPAFRLGSLIKTKNARFGQIATKRERLDSISFFHIAKEVLKGINSSYNCPIRAGCACLIGPGGREERRHV